MILQPATTLMHPLVLNSSGLSIISFQFAKTNPQWYSGIFGKNRVWFNVSVSNRFSKLELSRNEILKKNLTSMDEVGYVTNDWHKSSSCSIQLLGVVRLEYDRPFRYDSRFEGPGIGKASISWREDVKNVTWICQYRALYENWREEKFRKRPSFWPIIFYCSSPVTAAACTVLKVNHSNVDSNASVCISVSANLSHSVWKSNFSVQLIAVQNSSTAEPSNTTKAPMVVCGVISYTAYNESKARANGAMMMEWIHHYSSLGFKVYKMVAAAIYSENCPLVKTLNTLGCNL